MTWAEYFLLLLLGFVGIPALLTVIDHGGDM